MRAGHYREGGAQRLEIVAARLRALETQQRDAVGRGAAGEIAEERPEAVVRPLGPLDFEDAARAPALVEIRPGERRVGGGGAGEGEEAVSC